MGTDSSLSISGFCSCNNCLNIVMCFVIWSRSLMLAGFLCYSLTLLYFQIPYYKQGELISTIRYLYIPRIFCGTKFKLLSPGIQHLFPAFSGTSPFNAIFHTTLRTGNTGIFHINSFPLYSSSYCSLSEVPFTLLKVLLILRNHDLATTKPSWDC